MSEEQASEVKADTANQPEGSAPQTNDGAVVAAQGSTEQKQDKVVVPKSNKDFFRLRSTLQDKVRSEKEEKEQLRAELDALKAQINNTASSNTQKRIDPLEDPDGYSGSIEKRATEAAERRFNELLSQHNVQSSAANSEQWLRSRSHLEDDNKAADEVADIIANQYGHLVRLDPRAAARSAYSDWCEMKGVSPDLSSSNASLNPPRHAKLSSAGSGSSRNDKTYTPQEVANTLRALNTPAAIDAYTKEVEKAAREGRYKGKFIQLG